MNLPISQEISNDEFIRGKLDTKKYKYITLPNKLKVLLISDWRTDWSAASICVHVGSNSSPKQFPGLAHFCEHMVYLGTAKYPDEKKHTQFLIDNGGAKNAYTSTTKTVFYFKILNKAYEKYLDIFSQFITAPLFSDFLADRELDAINSEYNKLLYNDASITDSIYRYESNPLSAHHHFQCGNKETLTQPGIKEALISFFTAYYCANNMGLVLYGKDDINTLELFARNYFSGIANRNIESQLSNIVPYQENQCTLFKYYSISNIPILKMLFNMPTFSSNYNNRDSYYIIYILNNKAKNSFISYLKHKGWATSVSSDMHSYEYEFDQLWIYITLTDQGFVHYNQVIEVVFAYRNKLINSDDIGQLVKEATSIEQMEFEYKCEYDAIEDTAALANQLVSLNYESIKDILWAFNVSRSEFDNARIKECLLYMNPGNCQIFIASNTLESECKLQEPWTKCKYAKEILCTDVTNKLSNCKVEVTDDGIVLDIPEKNPYIPENLTLIPEGMNNNPKIIRQNQCYELWYMQYHLFKIPKTIFEFFICTPDLCQPDDIDRYISFVLWQQMFAESFKPLIESAKKGQISCSTNRGLLNMIEYKFNGYSDKLPLFIKKYFTELKAFDPSKEEDLFEIQKQVLLRIYKKQYLNPPYAILTAELYSYIRNALPRYCTIIPFLKNLSFSKFIAIWELNILKSGYIISFAFGNITSESSITLIEDVCNILKLAPIPSINQLNLTRLVDIAEKSEYYIVNRSVAPFEKNSAILSYFQSCNPYPYYHKSTMLNSLLIQIISEKCLSDLKIKQKIGSVVNVYKFDVARIPGGVLLIQSSELCPEELYVKINEFLISMRGHLASIEQKKLIDVKQSIRKFLMQPYNNMECEESDLSFEISSYNLDFHQKSKQLEELETIELKQVIDYYDALFYSRVKRVDIEYVSDNHWNKHQEWETKNNTNKRRVKINNEYEIRALNSLYPSLMAQNLFNMKYK